MKSILRRIDKDMLVAAIAIACAVFAYGAAQQSDEAAIEVCVSE